MAGDLAVAEGLFARGERRALAAPAEGMLHVLHDYGPAVRLTVHGTRADAGFAASAPLPSFIAAAAPMPGYERDKLAFGEQLGLAAFEQRSSDVFIAATQERRHAGAQWAAAPEAFAPDPPDGTLPAIAGAPLPGAAPARPMTGRIAVGLIIVSGPTADLEFTDQEKVDVTAQVQNGLTWLGTQSAGAAITWVYDIRDLQIDAPPPATTDFDALEAAFRDPALASMGHPAGLVGSEAAVAAMCAAKNCASGYLAFFTKYPTGHFAYAYPNGPHLVMQHANDGWGPSQIDRVYAHETCHIFGAPDEYAESGCDCGGAWGTSQGPNANCENCAQPAVACIMQRNAWEMCTYTRGFLGFPD